MIRLALAGLRHHGRTTLGVVAGLALAAALIVGGLTVDDGLRAALAGRTDARLGPADVTITRSGGFLTAALAGRVGRALGEPVAPALVLEAVASTGEGRSRRVLLVGLDSRIEALGQGVADPPDADSAAVPAEVAEALEVAPGDRVVLRFERPSGLPADSALTRAEDRIAALPLTVQRTDVTAWPVGYAPTMAPAPPPVVLVPLEDLARAAGVEGRANTLFVAGTDAAGGDAEAVRRALTRSWTLADAGLTVTSVGDEVHLGTDAVLLSDVVATEATALAGGATPALTWFVDGIDHGDASTPYTFVTAVPPSDGPRRPTTALPVALPADLADDEIVLQRWLADDLGASVGDEVVVRYPVLGRSRSVTHDQATFTVRAVVPATPTTADPSWTPPIEGLTGRDSCRSWDPGLPVDLSAIRDRDEAWWQEHGAASKAFVTLAAGQRMWSNPHGSHTGVRLPAGTDAESLGQRLTLRLRPEDVGLHTNALRARAEAAEDPANDFGVLFLGFEFVLLVSALLLVAMLAGFSLTHRRAELGALRAMGWSRRRVLGLLGLEASGVAILGALAGIPGGLVVAALLQWGLTGVWSSAAGGLTLPLAPSPATVATGAVVSAAVGGLTLLGVSWRLVREPTRGLLLRSGLDAGGAPPGRWVRVATGAAALLAGGVVLTTPAARTPEAALAFFGAGGLVLAAGLGVTWLWIARDGGQGFGRTDLGARGSARRPSRSLAVVGWIATGTFLVLGVGLGGGQGLPDATDPAGGAGAFDLWVQTHLAVPHHPSDPDATELIGLPSDVRDGISWLAARRLDGDDASCKQLGSAQTPGLIGLDPSLLAARQAMTFTAVAEGFGDDPWSALQADLGEGVVPAVGDAGTVTWGLHRGVRDRLSFTDEQGRSFEVEIVGVTTNTVFQGSLLVDEAHFLERFPSDDGYRTFLVDPPPGEAEAVSSELVRAWVDRGVEVTTTQERLMSFADVEHTYVRIFHALGGLGLLLGAVGLGLVLARAVVERQAELALLTAVGFEAGVLGRLLWWEHARLLALGLCVGGLAAVVAVGPVLAAPDAHPPWGLALAVWTGTAAVGTLALAVSVRRALAAVPIRVLIRDG